MIRQDPPGLMVNANNVFIVNEDDVVVVDANGAPAIAGHAGGAAKSQRSPLAVINTHYHDDHIRGNSVYRDAFPGVAFIAHAFAIAPGQGAVDRNFLEGAPPFRQLAGMLKDDKSLMGGALTAEERTSMTSDINLADLVLRDGAAAEDVTVTNGLKNSAAAGHPPPRQRPYGRGPCHPPAGAHRHHRRPGGVAGAARGQSAVAREQVDANARHAVRGAEACWRSCRATVRCCATNGHVRHASAPCLRPSPPSPPARPSRAGNPLEAARKKMSTWMTFRAQLAGESRVRQLLFICGPTAVSAAWREAGGR